LSGQQDQERAFAPTLMTDWPDKKIRTVAQWYIEKASMDPATWRFTLIGTVHPAVSERITMQEGELPLVSCFFSDANWYLFTTRRMLGSYRSQQVAVVPTEIVEEKFGNFKGYRGEETNLLTLTLPDGRTMQLEYETGKASMAPIYYVRFWKIKYPVLDKLLSDDPHCPYCGKLLRRLGAQRCRHCGADWRGKRERT
jgi:hypothetical protein